MPLETQKNHGRPVIWTHRQFAPPVVRPVTPEISGASQFEPAIGSVYANVRRSLVCTVATPMRMTMVITNEIPTGQKAYRPSAAARSRRALSIFASTDEGAKYV